MRKILGAALLSSPFVGILAWGAISGQLIRVLVAFAVSFGVLAVTVAGTVLLEEK